MDLQRQLAAGYASLLQAKIAMQTERKDCVGEASLEMVGSTQGLNEAHLVVVKKALVYD